MEDLCANCDIPERDCDPSDPEFFSCSDCSCYQCKYLHCCEGQCGEEGADNCVKCETDCAFNRLGCCMDALQMAAADRLEELTASQHVMTMREDA